MVGCKEDAELLSFGKGGLFILGNGYIIIFTYYLLWCQLSIGHIKLQLVVNVLNIVYALENLYQTFKAFKASK